MTKYANILCTRHELPLGKYYATYEWQGKKNWPVFIDDRFLEIQGVEHFPWPLELVDRQGDMLVSVYMRKDTIFPWWMLTKIKISFGKLLLNTLPYT